MYWTVGRENSDLQYSHKVSVHAFHSVLVCWRDPMDIITVGEILQAVFEVFPLPQCMLAKACK